MKIMCNSEYESRARDKIDEDEILVNLKEKAIIK